MLYDHCNFMRSCSLIKGTDRGKGKIKKPPDQPAPRGSPCRRCPAAAAAPGDAYETLPPGPLPLLSCRT